MKNDKPYIKGLTEDPRYKSQLLKQVFQDDLTNIERVRQKGNQQEKQQGYLDGLRDAALRYQKKCKELGFIQ
ncbi:MAG: hypothetical protein R3213_09345 [Flavobacteriaceae bacterium]|nr:hypothetical protein [Flavobacteriaceae bacterium]